MPLATYDETAAKYKDLMRRGEYAADSDREQISREVDACLREFAGCRPPIVFAPDFQRWRKFRSQEISA